MNDNYSKRRIDSVEWAKRRIDAGEWENPGGNFRPAARKHRINKRKFARTVILFICIIVAGLAICHYFSERTLPVSAESQNASAKSGGQGGNPLAGKLIVLDAGHGGFDIGATGVSGVFEDDLNLKVARYLKANLEENGAQVIMTREDENAIAETKGEDMAKRRQIIQQSGSDIVVSIHMNSETDSSFSGPIVLFMPSSVGGENLAKSIQQCLLTELHPKSENNARAEDLFITASGTQPCVIVECGFISNPDEEALLVRKDYQKKIARAITDGCRNYFSENK